MYCYYVLALHTYEFILYRTKKTTITFILNEALEAQRGDRTCPHTLSWEGESEPRENWLKLFPLSILCIILTAWMFISALPIASYLVPGPLFFCGHRPLFFRGAKQTQNSVLSGRSRGKARKILLMCSRVGSSVCCTGRQVTDSGRSLGLSAVFIFQMRIITESFSLSGGECRIRHCICLILPGVQ